MLQYVTFANRSEPLPVGSIKCYSIVCCILHYSLKCLT